MHTNRAERGKMTIVSEKHEDFFRDDNLRIRYRLLETGKDLQSASTSEGCGVRICATEAAVAVHRLVAATLLEDILAE